VTDASIDSHNDSVRQFQRIPKTGQDTKQEVHMTSIGMAVIEFRRWHQPSGIACMQIYEMITLYGSACE